MASDNEQEKRETLADIVTEFRAMPSDIIIDAKADFVFARYADRIEAAWRRDVAEIEVNAAPLPAVMLTTKAKIVNSGNAAAMREALREAIGETCAGCSRDCDDCINLKSGWMKKAKAALSAPARNCDIYHDRNETSKVFQETVLTKRERERAKKYPLAVMDWFIDWLFAPAAEKGADDGK